MGPHGAPWGHAGGAGEPAPPMGCNRGTLPSLLSARGGHGDPCDTWELIEDVVQVDRYKADSYHPFSNQMGLL
jgi:hypothetical protein